MTATLDSLDGRLTLLNGVVNNLKTQVDGMEASLRAVFASKTALAAVDANLLSQFESLNTIVTELDERYATIVSPTATKFYLSEADMNELQTALRTWRALLTEVQNVMANTVTTTARNNA